MKIKIAVTLLSCMVLLSLSSCSMMSGRGEQVQSPVVPLSCIVILPASTSVQEDSKMNYEKAQALEMGAQFADSVLQSELVGNKKVRILSRNQLANLVPGIEGGFSGTISSIGQKVNCDGVMVTTVSEFKQREGSSMGSESPASTEFNMVLRHSKNGAVLWSADFQETQDSFLTNIFSFNKMQRRGFKWVSVEELMENGIIQRLGECPYL